MAFSKNVGVVRVDCVRACVCVCVCIYTYPISQHSILRVPTPSSVIIIGQSSILKVIMTHLWSGGLAEAQHKKMMADL